MCACVLTGIVGEKGFPGSRGLKGSPGVNGSLGEKGDIGPAGPKGKCLFLSDFDPLVVLFPCILSSIRPFHQSNWSVVFQIPGNTNVPHFVSGSHTQTNTHTLSDCIEFGPHLQHEMVPLG